MKHTLKTGKFGENICAEYLKHMGYQIIKTNYHSRYGEIDIIASNDNILAFVEVKTRSTNSFFTAIEAVDYRKINRIIKTAYEFLKHYTTPMQPRFDICEIYIDKNIDILRLNNINYIENAFDLDNVIL